MGGNRRNDREPLAAAAVALTIDAAKWRRRRGMKRLLAALAADEGMTRYVGGAVRDDLLDLPVSDVDLATRLEPEEVVERLEAVYERVDPRNSETSPTPTRRASTDESKTYQASVDG